jgi:hypothetical protein
MVMAKSLLELPMIICPIVRLGQPVDGLVMMALGHSIGDGPEDIEWLFRAMVPVYAAQFIAKNFTESVGHGEPAKSSIIGVERPAKPN